MRSGKEQPMHEHPAVGDNPAPPIHPVPEGGADRPLWSVMIPTYNCARYLRQTLESVLAQDPGGDQMQIEVVDDASTDDNPGSVVAEVGRGRVAFWRKDRNEGAIANFNTCINRARGHLVHILHGDDYVVPGFYQTLARTAERLPDMALMASRAFIVDEAGVILEVTERVPALEEGGRTVDAFFYTTPIQTPGVVVRRSFYEAHGGFRPDLVHTADCEMWSRAAALGGGVILPDVLACYRRFAGNDSGRLARTAENLRDLQRLNRYLAGRHAQFDVRRGQRRVCTLAMVQLEHFRRKGDGDAVRANAQFLKSAAPLPVRAGMYARRLVGVVARALWRGAFLWVMAQGGGGVFRGA